VVIDIVLPAVLGLVLVREAGIETSSHKLEGLGLTISVRHLCDRYSRCDVGGRGRYLVERSIGEEEQ